MVSCFVPDCNHTSEKNGCKMFRFPHLIRSPQRRLQWKKLITRKDCSPGKSGRVCSCHFHGGKSRIPEIFERNKTKRILFSSPDKRKRSPSIPVSLNVVADDSASHSVDDCNNDQDAKTSGDNSVTVSHSLTEEIDNSGKEENDVQLKLKALEKEICDLRSENLVNASQIYFLQRELEENKKEAAFGVSSVADHINHFTGLPNLQVFDLVFSLFENQEIKYYAGWTVKAFPKRDQLLMTLMKLKRNYTNIDLALRFQVSKSTVTNVFLTWIHALHEMLVEGVMAKIPSRHKNKASMPKAFCEYGSCRIVIDCTEVFTAIPKKMSTQNLMYSDYKHRITLKGLVDIAPNGTVTYVSELFPGSTSDKEIVKTCGILEKLESGDFVMADKGFLIGDILPPGVALNIPPFKTTAQFTPSQVSFTLSIAQSRIHVERRIQTGKTFQILQFIPGKYVPYASLIFQVCFALCNFKKPLIKEVEGRM